MKLIHALQGGEPVVRVGVSVTHLIGDELCALVPFLDVKVSLLVTPGFMQVYDPTSGYFANGWAFSTRDAFEYAHVPVPEANEADLVRATLDWLRLIGAAWHTHLSPEATLRLRGDFDVIQLLEDAELVEVEASDLRRYRESRLGLSRKERL